MTKIEIAAHLANLTFIMDHHERLGTSKNPNIVEEFRRCHEEFISTLKKEQENETRSS